jgi:DNA mismatch repair protein MSH6
MLSDNCILTLFLSIRNVTGKFYELFHMDADVGVEVMDLIYMKGHIAHAGFPEISYGPMADKLVRAGFKVARVEQTETPAMLQERKKNNGRGTKTPKVVNREVCSVMTLGTRTFCYLDEQSALSQEENGQDGGTGPLLAIREVLVVSSEQEVVDAGDSDEVCPVCEYGITVIDAVRGAVTIGQFADDVLRSRLHTLLTAYAPSEVSALCCLQRFLFPFLDSKTHWIIDPFLPKKFNIGHY